MGAEGLGLRIFGMLVVRCLCFSLCPADGDLAPLCLDSSSWSRHGIRLFPQGCQGGSERVILSSVNHTVQSLEASHHCPLNFKFRTEGRKPCNSNLRRRLLFCGRMPRLRWKGGAGWLKLKLERFMLMFLNVPCNNL